MPELPWVKWYPSNWASEPGIRQCDPATRGIWFEALNTMFLWGTGTISGTLPELSVLLLCRQNQLQVAILELKKFKVAEIEERDSTDGQQNANIIITCRRTVRFFQLKGYKSKAGKVSANRRRTEGQQPSTSTSTSVVQGEVQERESVEARTPTLEEIKELAAVRGIPFPVAKAFFDYHDSNNLWLNRWGRPIKIDAKLVHWAATERQNGTHQQNSKPRVDRNAGTANEGRAHMYSNYKPPEQ